MPAHSTVKYVEPNVRMGMFSATSEDLKNGYELDIWHNDDGFDRAPRLEDYCIALNLEVEISSRDTVGQTKDVLILQWGSDNKERVSFMGGTKVGGYEMDGSKLVERSDIFSRNNLTTYYADMYVGDLVDYGTTEMIGIKSVNIEYAKSCVPVISIKFTDVRGLSLFQPTELSRTNTYNGIRGISRDNVAQSFFQCFFKMPLPKFTIYIKGFYGKPVAYVMMCDKFETNFNSETGDYDVDTRFIGYSYSFLTDISFDALLAAPYSDFGGKKYWDEQVNGDNPRFFLWDKLHTKKMPMPTLYEAHSHFKKLITTSAEEMLETTESVEESTHEEEIARLREIQGKYQLWYQELFNLLTKKYNKRYCFDFRDFNGDNSEWYRILILTNNNTSDVENLSEAYKDFSDDFKKTNGDLYAMIEDFNASSGFKKLNNISKDFSKYTRQKLFRDCYVNRNNRKIEFGGFDRECRVNKTQVVNRLFYGKYSDVDKTEKNAYDKFYNSSTQNEKDEAKNKIDEVNKYRIDLTDFTLSTIYGDGTNQYKDAFIIEVDYSDIERRIKALIADASKDSAQKEREKRRKEHNRLMMSKMNWYPSVENFMKIVMAHVETYMMMLYKVKDACENRTPESVGVTVGPDADVTDVNENTKRHLTPFPRVTKKEIGSDGIERTVDSWVGDYNGKERFIEADLVNGFFNAVDYLQQLYKEDSANNSISESSEIQTKSLIKFPLTSYDFNLTKNPYGSDTDISNNPNAFAAKVAIRMFNILSINNFKKEYGDKWSFANTEFLEKLGQLEADNFHYCVPLTNNNMRKMLGVEGGEGTITPDTIIECVKNNTPIGDITNFPWATKNGTLFDKNFWLSYFKTAYPNKTMSRIYPTQDISFSALNETLIKFNKGVSSIEVENEDIAVDWFDTPANAWRILNSKNRSSFGNLYIIDDYKEISNILESSCASINDSYKEVYELIRNASTFNNEDYRKLIYSLGVFRPKKGIKTPEVAYPETLGLNATNLFINPKAKGNEGLLGRVGNTVRGEKIEYSFDSSKLEEFANEAENKSIISWFFTECRGFSKVNGKYEMALNKSLFAQDDYINGLIREQDDKDWIYGNTAVKRMGFFIMGLEAIDYTILGQQLGNNKTFAYMPKLAVLQIGAALTSLPNIKAEIKNTNYLSSYIRLPRTFQGIINYLDRISYPTRLAYIRYFRDWVNEYNADIATNLFNKKNFNVAVEYSVGNLKRTLFKEDSQYSQGLADMLMTPVVVVKGNVNHYRYKDNDDLQKGLMFSESTAKSFLSGFLSRLRELYSVDGTSGGEGVKLAAEPTKTTEDMKKDLYRYMKLVYEKWVPAMTRDEWMFETFFDADKEKRIRNGGACGHLFHFIDSYYNKIGDKLLINPMGLSEIIDNALAANNVNTMVLGFIADVLAKNKTMMLCLQNFQDLGEDSAMEMMFKPIPYNGMRNVNKHPDFVILYPYEPSKYLNVDNGEFNDDSFMLNDEFATPLAIKSRGANPDTFYRIPAFGVSYGKQYQSYFKKVNVGMQSPIATQQSIMAKHAILRSSQDGHAQSTQAQDLYDIYASQSYTCTVEMMGCAWVQPLMYFVLTNVPLFKGSYLIFKVTHQITQGNMTTTFQGTRMANVANRLVDEIFTDDDMGLSPNEPNNEDKRNALANVDNDCPYKVYPLFEDKNVKLSKNELENANNAMRMLMTSGFTKEAAAGICGNIYVESNHWNLYAIGDNGKAFGLCQWRGTRRKLLEKRSDSTRPSFEQQIDFIRFEWFTKPSEGGDSAYNYRKELLAAKTPDGAAEIVCNRYERPSVPHMSERKERAKKYYNAYNQQGIFQKISQIKVTPNNQNIYNAFLNAVQKSLASTNCSVGIKLDNANRIVQTDGGNEKMDLVFDIILNGYYEYVQTLSWITKEQGGAYMEKPSAIEVTVLDKNKVKAENRRVYVYHNYSNAAEQNKHFGNDASAFNKSLLKSLYKRYKANANSKKELPQFDNFDIFKEIQVKDCKTLMTNYYGASGNIEGFSGEVKNTLMQKVLSDVNHINSKKLGNNFEIKLNEYHHCCTSGPTTWYNRAEPGLLNSDMWWSPDKVATSTFKSTKAYLNKAGFKCVWYGNKEDAKHLTSKNLRPGDICTIFVENSSHGAMWTGHDWRSDAIQKGIWIYDNKNGREGNKSVCIWRNPKYQEDGMSVIEIA